MSRRTNRSGEKIIRLPVSPPEPMKQNGVHRAATPPSALPEHLMQVDFAEYGYTETERQQLASLKEPAVDSCAQIAHGRMARERREAERVLQQSKAKRERREPRGPKEDGAYIASGTNGGATKRRQIYLDAEKNWVLFDPVQEWPPTLESPPPAPYEKYSRYRRGNEKVVAYNIESFAVSLRKTPDSFAGFEVIYNKSGPKLVKATKASRPKYETE